MNTKLTLLIAVVAIAGISFGVIAPILATATGQVVSPVTRAAVVVDKDSYNLALVRVADHIGTNTAHGYGVITDAGLNAVMVTTTHAGVKDSALQADANDPIWHNHYVKLANDPAGLCGSNPQVVDITYESPGRVGVNDHLGIMRALPFSFNGTNALTGQPTILTPGSDPKNVVSFDLQPIFQNGNLSAVCVTNIAPAQTVGITNIFNN